MWVQVDGVKGYDEDQVALFIPDLTAFGLRLMVTLGTPTINQIVNMIKEICVTKWIKDILPTGRTLSGTLP